MTVREQIAQNFRRARERRGLTQAQVADRLGIHRVAVTEIEAGRRAAKIEELIEIAPVLGVKPQELWDVGPGRCPTCDRPLE